MPAPSFDLYCGDALEVLPRLTPGGVDCIVTSPPYAQQRQREYGGVDERAFPAWLADRLDAARPALTERASVAIVIRPHVRRGELSDYVLRTRLELRDRGWIECDEWIWDKGSGMPMGSKLWPRRSWEHILWFAPRKHPWCDPRANGKPTDRMLTGHGGRIFRHGYGGLSADSAPYSGVARGIDVARVPLAYNTRGDDVAHPAPYPPRLAAWMLAYLCPPEGTVLDPFAGSGSTGVAALEAGRSFIGIDRDRTYVAMMDRRLNTAATAVPLS